jgi:hypothetical protein
MRYKFVIISAAVAICSLFSNARAQILQQDIHNALGNLCLDADTRTIGSNGTIVQMWNCAGVPNQRWRFQSNGTIQNVQSGRCLDAFAPTVHNDGGSVVLWDCSGGATQQWRQMGGQFLVIADPMKCLDNSAPTARQNGSKIQVWMCNNSPQQTWIPSPIISETMTDRCSGDVLFPTNYDDGPNSAILPQVGLVRGRTGWTNWSRIFEQRLEDDHFVRWWCHSTTGNWLDPGTWRFTNVDTACQVSGGDLSDIPNGDNEQCSGSFTIRTRDVNGWTAERSRCGSRTGFFQARLGPDRLLEIRCIQP